MSCWKTLRKNKDEYTEKEDSKSQRSEEINDIIDRMPTSFGKWVSIAVVVFFLLFLILGWIIKYPDAVTGTIKINSTVAPIKLVANMSGKLNLLKYQAQDTVKENDYIAIIQNPANTNDMIYIMNVLEEFYPNNTSSIKNVIDLLPEKVSLGELNLKYYTFLTALKDCYNYEIENIFEQQRLSIEDGIKWKKNLFEKTQTSLKIAEEHLSMKKKWYERYTSLNKDVATFEQEIDRINTEYLNAKQSEENLKKEAVSLEMQISESLNRLSQLAVEQDEKEKVMQMNLLSAYNDLKDNLKLWEQKYVLKAPFDGIVEFLNFWTDGQFVQAGESVFSIIPKENTIFGQMYLPANGAGKVKVGNEVKTKLDNYPYREYGSIRGEVKSISLITQEQKTTQSVIETYLIIVELPDGLITNYGESLEFKYEISGIADIIAKDRRLIERLFDNLRVRTK